MQNTYKKSYFHSKFKNKTILYFIKKIHHADYSNLLFHLNSLRVKKVFESKHVFTEPCNVNDLYLLIRHLIRLVEDGERGENQESSRGAVPRVLARYADGHRLTWWIRELIGGLGQSLACGPAAAHARQGELEILTELLTGTLVREPTGREETRILKKRKTQH